MEWSPTRNAALSQLEAFLPRAGKHYEQSRNHDDGPDRANVSLLSPWLHAGILSERELLQRVLATHSPRNADKFVSEVFWRVYFKGYLEQRPKIWRAYCNGRDAACAAMEGNSGLRTAYSKAVSGQTGIEAFDHWARELDQTGYLHNHARMWFASIWIFTLKLDWHLGADFFLRHLVDGDAASNTLSWRWVAGLHTKGKNYAASEDTIARFTANHPQGPLAAPSLAQEPEALTEAQEFARTPIAWPQRGSTRDITGSYALLLHDDAASHVPLQLPGAPVCVLGIATPNRRSPEQVGDHAASFAEGAIEAGMQDAAREFSCPARRVSADDDLSAVLREAGAEMLVTAYQPHGWTRDSLAPMLDPLRQGGQLVEIIDPLSRATWPCAKAGFFGVKKVMHDVIGEVL